MIRPVFSKIVTKEEKEIRSEVFEKEQGFVDEFDEVDNNSWHLTLFYNDYPIAVARFYPEDPETFHVGRVAVRKEFRGKKDRYFFNEVRRNKNKGIRRTLGHFVFTTRQKRFL